MKFKAMNAAAVVCLAGIALGQPAFADLVTLTLTEPSQAGTVGSVLTFTGSLTNANEPSVTIVGYNFNGLPVTLTFDDTPFVTNFLGQDIAAGGTLGPLSFFTVTIEDDAVPGAYDAVFSVVFDSAGGTGQETNFQTFSITVIPEATSLWLLGLGLTAMATIRFTRRFLPRASRCEF